MRLFTFSLFLCIAAPGLLRAGALEELKASAPKDAAIAAPAATPAAQVSAPSLPAEFTIRERVISWTDTFDLKAGSKTFGTITEKFLSLTKSFKYVDASGACVAEARARFLSWGSHVEVADCQGRKIGSIKENVFKSFFKIHTTYAILDSANSEIATSEKVEWVSTSLTLTGKRGQTVATLRRPWLNLLSDEWTVKVADPAAVDSRLIVMIAAYKTSVDNDRRREKSSKSEE